MPAFIHNIEMVSDVKPESALHAQLQACTRIPRTMRHAMMLFPNNVTVVPIDNNAGWLFWNAVNRMRARMLVADETLLAGGGMHVAEDRPSMIR